MTAINPTTNIAPPQATPNTSRGQASAEESASSLASDFDTFLTLLTAQLRNQDPLEPLDSTQFVEQLATFSSVEQQVETNRQLAELVDGLGGGVGSLADWVGHKVEAAAAVRFDGGPVTLNANPDGSSVTAALIVTDPEGREVSRSAINPLGSQIIWDGTTTDGDEVDPGLYSFTIARVDGEGTLSTEIPQGFSKVAEARLINGEITLILEGGEQVLASNVTALRD